MAKYKKGDKVRWDHNDKVYEVECFLNEDQQYEGNWSGGFKSILILGKNYILKNEKGYLEYEHMFSVEGIHFSLVERSKVVSEEYPHTCKRCGAPAYVGLNDVECSSCGRY